MPKPSNRPLNSLLSIVEKTDADVMGSAIGLLGLSIQAEIIRRVKEYHPALRHKEAAEARWNLHVLINLLPTLEYENDTSPTS